MPRKSSKPRGGPGRVAPAPELHWKALDPKPVPAEVPECSHAAKVPDDVASVDIVEMDRLRLDVPAAAEDALAEEEIVRKLVGIGGEEMDLSEEELRANHQMQEDEERLKSRQLQSDQSQMDEVRNLQAIMRDAKQCPRCKIAISKISGCNKMTCSNCGHYFCYQCNFAIVGYDHFKAGACDMFSLEERDRWEAQMNPGGRRVQTPAPGPLPLPKGRYGHPCPTCRKSTQKMGNNNHIKCDSCQTQFCALCRKTVQRTSQHFGPKGCKQHTADPD